MPIYGSDGACCEVKGTFSKVQKANDVAIAVFSHEYPNCQEMDVIEKGKSQDP